MHYWLSVSVSVIALVALSACQHVSLAKPDFPVSYGFEGQWRGERIDVSGDSICRPTTIVGSVTNSKARLRLSYNQTLLTGWIAQNGSVVLTGDHPRWDYKFTGQARGNEIKGDWMVGNAPCRGSWHVRRN